MAIVRTPPRVRKCLALCLGTCRAQRSLTHPGVVAAAAAVVAAAACRALAGLRIHSGTPQISFRAMRSPYRLRVRHSVGQVLLAPAFCAICGAAQPPQASTAAGGAGKLGCGGMRHDLGALHGPLRAVAHESGCCGAQMPLGGATLTWSDALGTHQVAAPASVLLLLPPRARAPRQSISAPRAHARGCNALFRRGRHCRHRQNARCSFAWRAPSPVGQAAPRSAHEADGALHVSSVHQLTSPPFPLLSCACAEGRSVARGACSSEVPQEGECGAEHGARQRRARRRPNRIRSAWRAVSRERVRACARGWAAAVAGESAA